MTYVLVAVLCPFQFAIAQPSGGAALTLEGALALARSNNRDLKQGELDVARQQEALAEAKTHRYPRLDTALLAAQLFRPLDFTIKEGQLGTYPATGPIPGSDIDLHTPARPVAIASVTATQPLTQLIRIHLSVADQRLKIEAAQLALDERGQKLSDDVRQAYYQVLQAQIQHGSQQSMVKHLEELQRITDQRVREKAALTADGLIVRAELARAAYQLTTIADTLADRKDALNHLLGRSVQTEFAVEPVPATLPDQEDLLAATAKALEHRPELKLAANRVHQATLAIRGEKTRYIPDVSIQASYFSPANVNFLPQNIGSIGALLTWQPWDWGEKRHKVRQAALAAEQAELAAADTRERILLDVASSFRRLREAHAHLAVTEAMRDAENERLRNQEEAYSQRAILLSDLLRQRSSVADAESQYQQAVLACWSARAEFQKTVGEE